ncbi:MAG: ChaN family lipoprotein [Desulfovibrionaceae bacterium]
MCILLAAVLSGCAAKQAPPLTLAFLPERGEFLSSSGERLSFHQALALAAGAEYVVLGEGHRNACDHDIQQRVARGLAEAGAKPGEPGPAIGLEMVPANLQPVLDRFNAGEIAPEDLDRELDWNATWGYPYALFEPLFALAQERSLPVGALNVPRDTVRRLGEGGLESLTPEDREYVASSIIGQLPETVETLRAVFAMHEGLEPSEERFERFVLVQSAWESTMAERAVALRERTGRPVLVLAGAGHVEGGDGIPRRIRLLDPGARVEAFVPVRDVYDFAPGGQVAFYCPADYASRMGMTLEVRQGRVTVTDVTPAGRAAGAGLRPGDVLLSAQGVEVRGLMDLHRAGKLAHDTNRSLVFEVERSGASVGIAGVVRVRVDMGSLGASESSGGMDSMNGRSERGNTAGPAGGEAESMQNKTPTEENPS